MAYWIASLLFFLSGGTGLAYQVIWSKRFGHVWGNSTLAMAAVVASFLFGLGAGAHFLGRVADRVRSPLFWYGASEAAVGFLAALIPFELKALAHVSAAIYPLLEAHPVLHSLVRFVLTFLVIGPPCVLMGGTLPLLIKHFTPPDSGAGAATGWLYAINTLGAALGCYLAGFHLLPTYGLFATNFAVALLNLVIGVSAILLAQQVAPLSPGGSEPLRGPERGAKAAPPALYATAAITGFAALALEMIWTRQLSLILGGSTYAFTAMLFLILVGIGVGSLIFHAFLRKSDDPSLPAAAVIAGLGVTTAVGKLYISHISVAVGTLKDLRVSQGWNASICVTASAVLELLPSIAMGILFPLFVALTRKRAAHAGEAIGAIYAWNTAGSIAGASLTSVVLLPAWGTSQTVAAAILLYAIALVLIFPYAPRPRRLVGFACCLLLMGAAAKVTTIDVDPKYTNMGFYMYGYIGRDLEKYDVAFFQEGASSNVLVTRQGDHFSLRVNGKVDASSGQDMGMQLGLAYFPVFLAPRAQNLCVIGLGSGTTVGSALLFPRTHVVCCEIERAVFEGSKVFKNYNHNPHDSPRLKVVFDDGRSHLQGTSTQYDLILSEPSNPWIAGVSNLFTREFYEAARDRLTPGGILAQWIQVYSFAPSEYAMIVKTVMSVFPHCGLISISAGDTILLASSAPITGTKESFDAAQALVASVPQVESDLSRYFATSDVRSIFLSHYILDTQALRTFADSLKDVPVNTDLNLKLEFDAPMRLFDSGETLRSVAGAFFEHARGDWLRSQAAAWGCTKEQSWVAHKVLAYYDKVAPRSYLKDVADLGLALDPDNVEALVDRTALEPPQDTAEMTRVIEKVLAASKKEANRLGVSLVKSKRFDAAVTTFLRVLAAMPESMTTWNNLAIAYDAWGKPEEAKKAFEKALSIDPVHQEMRKSYENFLQKESMKTEQQEAASPRGEPETTQGENP